MRTITALLLALLSCAGCMTLPDAQGVRLRLGMPHAEAMAQLRDAGASEVAVSYQLLSPGHRVHFTNGWFTLPNGLSVEIHGDRKDAGSPLLVTYLAICNSTALSGCRGETWYTVSEASLLADEAALATPCRLAESGERKDVQAYLFKGMRCDVIRQMLAGAGMKRLQADEAWLVQLPPEGTWARYSREGRADAQEIILHFKEGADFADDVVSLILVEAAAPAEGQRPAARHRVACEFLDLSEPLKERWHEAFDESCAWKPVPAPSAP
jgi:hypothetical protein